MKENETQFTMRMENGLYQRLKKRAERNKRSLAKELEYITEQALDRDDKKMDEILTKIFAAYKNEKPESLQALLDDDTIQTPLKSAALELLDFVKNI